MDATEPCEFIGFGAIDVMEPYQFLLFLWGFMVRAEGVVVIPQQHVAVQRPTAYMHTRSMQPHFVARRLLWISTLAFGQHRYPFSGTYPKLDRNYHYIVMWCLTHLFV
jgi:hypothetical protein